MRLIGFKAHVVPALAVLLCLLVGLPTGVSAQTETSRTLVGGQTIAWNDPWKLNSELTTSGDGFDLLAVETQLGLVGVGSYGYPIAGSEVRDIAIEAFAGEVALRQVDRGDYDNVSYSLDVADADGFAFGLFTLVVESSNGTLLSILLAPLDSFQAEMVSAQSSVSIDGSGIFEGVDASVMQGFLDVGTPPDVGTLPPAPTPATVPIQPTPETGSGGGLVGGINSELGSDDQPSAATVAAPTPAGGDSTTTVPALPNGYTIPSSGVTVSWSDEWSVSEQDQESIHLESAAPTAFLFVLDLGQVSPGGDVLAMATSISRQPGLEGSSVVAALEADNGQRNIIILAQTDAAGMIYLIYDVSYAEQCATAVLLKVLKEDLLGVLDAVSTTVQVDRQPVHPDLKELVPDLFSGSGT